MHWLRHSELTKEVWENPWTCVVIASINANTIVRYCVKLLLGYFENVTITGHRFQ